MTMTEELKPVLCGCGGEAIVWYADGFYRVQCSKCGIKTRPVSHPISRNFKEEKRRAIEEWNIAMSGHNREEEFCSWLNSKPVQNAEIIDGVVYCKKCGAALTREDDKYEA